MEDAEPIATTKAPDSMVSMVTDAVSSAKYKMALILFMLFIFLSSDVFVNRILGRIDGAVNGKCAATWGVLIQAMCLCIAYVILDMLIGAGVL